MSTRIWDRVWVLPMCVAAAVALAGCDTFGGGGNGGENAGPDRLTGAEVLGVVQATNQAEIELSQLGQERASDQRVEDFARRMVESHQQAQRELDRLQGQLGTQPTESQVSRRIRSESRDTVNQLRNQSGAAFDRAFMRAQVQMHQETIRRFDNRLIESAERPQLKQALRDMRSDFQSHLREAQQIQGQLGQ